MEFREDAAQRIGAPHFSTRSAEEDWLRMLRLASNEDISFERLAQEMERCAGIPFALIRAANSAVVGVGTEVRSLRHALALLGLRRIQDILAEGRYVAAGERTSRVAV